MSIGVQHAKSVHVLSVQCDTDSQIERISLACSHTKKYHQYPRRSLPDPSCPLPKVTTMLTSDA